MSRKIVVCLDGTGNEIETNESNVLRLYKTLKRTEDQLVYYHPGVGTIDTNPFAKLFWSKPKLIAGLIFGAGLETNVLRAYEFLCRNYREGDDKKGIDGDRLYFFGYSRGAYTARVLAGFINDFGLVDPSEFHLVAPVFRAWRTISSADDRTAYAKVRMLEHAFTMRYPSIRFLGLWDTVSSLLRIKWGKGTFIQYGTHSSVNSNPSVESVRHVLAIDETRRFFRHQFWEEGHKYYQNRFNYKRREKLKRDWPDQDVKQVWFAGTHTDVAGSVYEPEAGLAKITMHWMREELDDLGVDQLVFRPINYDRYVLGKEDKTTAKMNLKVSKPNPLAPLHSQMKKGWFLLEWLPRKAWRSRWIPQRSFLGFYIPWGKHRFIPKGSKIHPTALKRKGTPGAKYDPPNLRAYDGTPPE